MKQIFILGSSGAYGVGSSNAGWGDLIKQHLHNKMYAQGGVGEKYEVYNFAKPGATIDFVYDNLPDLLEQYGRGDVIAVVSVGGNNSKAEDAPDNYVSTIEDYLQQMDKLFNLLKENCSHVISVGNWFVDESKTNPKPNPLTGGKSYFTNERRVGFSNKAKELCEQKGIGHIDVGMGMQEWVENYLYEDGLHPNQAGHQLIFESIKQELGPLL